MCLDEILEGFAFFCRVIAMFVVHAILVLVLASWRPGFVVSSWRAGIVAVSVAVAVVAASRAIAGAVPNLVAVETASGVVIGLQGRGVVGSGSSVAAVAEKVVVFLYDAAGSVEL